MNEHPSGLGEYTDTELQAELDSRRRRLSDDDMWPEVSVQEERSKK